MNARCIPVLVGLFLLGCPADPPPPPPSAPPPAAPATPPPADAPAPVANKPVVRYYSLPG